MSGLVKGLGRSCTGIRSLVRLGEERRAGVAHSLLGAVCVFLTCPVILGALKRLPT